MPSPSPLLLSSVPNLIEATFDRHHGTSQAPFASLNVAFTVGDQAARVVNNRQRMKEALGISRLVSARQVHGDQILRIQEVPEQDEERSGFDALMTDQRGVGLMIQHADCQAILLHDPANSVIAAVHCGWRGSVIGLIEKTVRAMSSCYASRPEDITAAISPSLGPCCAEFINYREELPDSFLPFQVRGTSFDFWRISRWQLIEAGLQPDKIRKAAICTSCSPDFFSYRRAVRQGNGRTGRNGTIIALASNR